MHEEEIKSRFISKLIDNSRRFASASDALVLKSTRKSFSEEDLAVIDRSIYGGKIT